MAFKVVLISALVVAALARPDSTPSYHAAPAPSYHAPAASYSAPSPVSPPKYDFNYGVNDDYSGNNYNAQETRDGYNTQGSYYVNLPDGRVQKVSYYVDADSGYVAEVTYEGEAQYPEETYGHAAPSYKAPSYGPAATPSYAPAPSYAPEPSYTR